MPVCPHCAGNPKPLPVLNGVSRVEFFQCEACGRLLERPKGSRAELVVFYDRAAPLPPRIQL